MTIGRLFGVRIVLNPFFLLLLLLLGVVGLLVEALIVFGVVFLHELAHVVTAKALGLQVREVELLPFGGVARIDDLVEIDPTIEISVAVAGPLTNVFLIGVALIEAEYGIVSPEWNALFLQTNVMIGGFNLLPALPLDGGRVYRAKMARRIGFRRATELAARVGKICAVILGLAGVLVVYYGYANISLIVLAFFVYFAAGKEQGLAAYVFMRYLGRKRLELQRQRCLPSHHLVALAETPIKEVLKNFVPKRYHIVWVLDVSGSISGLVTEIDVIDAMFEHGIETPVGNIAKGLK